MKILHNYIQKNVIIMTCLVVLIIAGLQTFISLVNEMGSLGKGGYDAIEAFNYALLSLPHNVYPLFPVAALIGCLVALGRLASQSELIVMRSSGVSKAQITQSVMLTTVLMLVFATVIGEFLAPTLQKNATDYKDEAMTKSQTTTRLGGWIRDGESFIYIQRVLPDNKLRYILRYQFKDDRLETASLAQKGEFVDNHWVMKGVSETHFYPNHTITKKFPKQIWSVSFDPNLIGLGQVDASETTLWSLYRYIEHLKKGGLSARSYEFSLWKRLFQPLVTLIMIGLAVPFIFGPLRTATMGSRILVGVIVGFGFYTLNEFLGPFSLVYQVPPAFAASLPAILFIMIDIWLFRRAS